MICLLDIWSVNIQIKTIWRALILSDDNRALHSNLLSYKPHEMNTLKWRQGYQNTDESYKVINLTGIIRPAIHFEMS